MVTHRAASSTLASTSRTPAPESPDLEVASLPGRFTTRVDPRVLAQGRTWMNFDRKQASDRDLIVAKIKLECERKTA